MRNRACLRPSVEGLEAWTLLSTAAGVVSHAATVEAQAGTTSRPTRLTGGVHGLYVERTANPDTGHTFSFGSWGPVKPLGPVFLTGLIASPGFIANGRSTGSLVLQGAAGTVTLSVTGPPQNGNAPVPDVFNFTITGATGRYDGDTGSGFIDLMLTPAAAFSPRSRVGRFSLQFLTAPPPTAPA